MGLDRVKALEVEDRLDEAEAGGVAVVDGGDVDAHRLADRRVVGKRLGEGAAQDLGADHVVVEALGDPVDDRVLEPLVIEHRRMDEARHGGLGPDDGFRVALHLEPDRIDAVQRVGGVVTALQRHMLPRRTGTPDTKSDPEHALARSSDRSIPDSSLPTHDLGRASRANKWRRHGRRFRKSTTASLKGWSPVASMWSRLGMIRTSAPGMSAGEPLGRARDLIAGRRRRRAPDSRCVASSSGDSGSR